MTVAHATFGDKAFAPCAFAPMRTPPHPTSPHTRLQSTVPFRVQRANDFNSGIPANIAASTLSANEALWSESGLHAAKSPPERVRSSPLSTSRSAGLLCSRRVAPAWSCADADSWNGFQRDRTIRSHAWWFSRHARRRGVSRHFLKVAAWPSYLSADGGTWQATRARRSS